MSKTLQVVYLDPGKVPEIRPLKDDVEAIQAMVGGGTFAKITIETEAGPMDLVYNDDPWIVEKLDVNFLLPWGDPVRGPVFFCRSKGANFMSVQDGDLDVVFRAARPTTKLVQDDQLVNLTEKNDATRQFFKLPVYCSRTVWTRIQAAVETCGNDLGGVVHDLSWMAYVKSRIHQNKQSFIFQCLISEPASECDPVERDYVMIIGPGDGGLPDLTILSPEDDALRKARIGHAAS